MINVTISFDNSFASPLSPKDFVNKYYLTELAKKEFVYMKIEQTDYPLGEKNDLV